MKNQKQQQPTLSVSLPRTLPWRIVRAALFVLAFSPFLRAQLPVSRLQSVFPPGAKAGTTLEISIAGTDLDEARQLIFSTTNISAALKTNAVTGSSGDQFLINVSSNTAPGFYEVRVAGRFGASNPRLFAVDARPELITPSTNISLAAAAEIPQGTWINGRVEAGNYAFFRFKAEKGRRLLVECLDSQIDSHLDASLILYNDKQRELARNRRGGLLDYVAADDEVLTLRLNDFLFRGGPDFIYRLMVSTRPHIDFAFPPAALPGTTNKVSLYGRNLPGGKPSDKLAVDGAKLDELLVEMVAPSKSASDELSGRRLGMNLAASVVDSFEYRLDATNGLSNPVLMSLATAPVIREHHSSRTNTQALSVPCEIAGQFFPADDRDWYAFDGRKGDVYWIEAFSDRLGIPADPFVVVQKVVKNAKGEEQISDLKELNDSDPNFGGAEFKTSSFDPAWRFAVPETGTYRVQVRDLFSRYKTDPRLVYRLSIRRETPDFRLVAVPSTQSPPKKDSKEVTLWSPVMRKGQVLPCKILVFRRDNFNGEIRLKAEGLPSFVSCPPVTVPAGSNSVLLLFNAATNATDWAGPIRIIGEAKEGTSQLVREARGASLMWGIPDNSLERAESRLSQHFVLSVCASEPAPIQLIAGEGKRIDAYTNSKIKIPVKVLRAPDWASALKLKPAGLAALSSVKELDVDGKSSSANLEIDLSKQKLAPGLYTFYLQSEAQGKYQNNPGAAKRAAAEAKEWEKKAAELAALAKKAADTAKAAAKAAGEAENASKKASEKLASAKSAAEQNDASESAKAARGKAEKEAAHAVEKARAAQEAKLAAEKALQEAEAKAREAGTRKEATAKRAKELADKSKAKDTAIYVYSNPVELHVADKAGK